MPRESKTSKRQRVEQMIEVLRKRYPDARTALNYSTPLELLVATVLSAQCTDERVNLVTRDLFRKYTKAGDYAEATQEQLQRDIRSIGLFRAKAKNIRAAAAKLVADFGGAVPGTMDELLTLPGVARKTANVVLGNAFGVNAGVVVDTHVARVAQRLKLTRHKKAMAHKIEKDLMDVVPREAWTLFGHLLIFHGRQTCTARKPRCPECPVNHLCPSAGKA